MAAKTHGERIEILESLAAQLAAQIEVQRVTLGRLAEDLKKALDLTEGHSSKITVVEQQLLILDLRSTLAQLANLEKELVGYRKEMDALQSWKSDWMNQRQEISRRWWAFGPSLVAALIAACVSTGLLFLDKWLKNL